MTDDRLLSHTISYLRFPLTVAVVFIHFNISRKGISVHGVNYGTDNPDWYIYLINFVSYVIASIAVPLFFFISGFLLFKQKEFNAVIYKKKLLSRVKTLLIPYFLWNLVAIVWQAIRLMPVLSPLFPGAYKTEVHFSIIRIFNTFFDYTLQNGIFVSPIGYTMTELNNEPYPIDIPLWYIRDLFLMVIISPIIYWFIRRFNVWYITILGIAWCVKSAYLPNGGYISMLITALFFFSWGGFHGINEINFVKEMKKFKFSIILYLPIAVLDTLSIYTPYNSYIHNIGIFIGLITVVNIASQLLESGKVHTRDILINSTFFVFALHKLIIDDVAKVLFSLLHLPDNTFVMLLFYLFVPIITIAICISIYNIIHKSFPQICNILTGGR